MGLQTNTTPPWRPLRHLCAWKMRANERQGRAGSSMCDDGRGPRCEPRDRQRVGLEGYRDLAEGTKRDWDSVPHRLPQGPRRYAWVAWGQEEKESDRVDEGPPCVRPCDKLQMLRRDGQAKRDFSDERRGGCLGCTRSNVRKITHQRPGRVQFDGDVGDEMARSDRGSESQLGGDDARGEESHRREWSPCKRCRARVLF